MDAAPKGLTGKRSRWSIWTLLTLVATLLVAALAGALWIDSDNGHAYIIEQVESLEPDDGLRIEIGALEGSIFGQVELQDLRFSDPQGEFFKAGSIIVEWNPLVWIFNELNVSSALVSQARLERLPRLRDTETDSALLPSFDIYIGAFRADNLAIGAAITGEAQYADLTGAVDIRAGRVMVNLDAATTRSGDSLTLVLSAEPDKEKLDIAADIVAPAEGVFARYLRVDQDISIKLTGDGDWSKWDGQMQMRAGDKSLSRSFLAARDGIFGFDSSVAMDMLPKGIVQKLAGPNLNVNGSMTFAKSVAEVNLVARSAALKVTASGGVDLTNNGLQALRVKSQVLNPSALLPGLKARDLEMNLLLNGRLSELRYQYLLSAPQLAIGKSLVTQVYASGKGLRNQRGWTLPLDFKMATLIGNGPLAKQLVSGFSGKALLRYEQGLLFAEKADFRTDSMAGKIDFELQPATGNYSTLIQAQAPGFLINGVGIADLLASLTLKPGANGVALGGEVTANIKRFDIGFLRDLGGGLPTLKSGLALGANGFLQFQGLTISAPKLTFDGSGRQAGSDSFVFDGKGQHDQYGDFNLTLEGPLARPQIALLLNNPLPAADLSAVRLLLKPVDNGFAYTATGNSALGDFDGDGAILTGSAAVVRVDRLLVSQTLAKGLIRPTAAGLAGRLNISGGGVNGSVRFEPATRGQLIVAKVLAKNARFDGQPPIYIRSGVLDADIMLVDDQSNINATVQAQGISRGDLIVGRVAGNAKLVNGSGSATFSIAGTRGSTFEFQARANIVPDRYTVTGDGLFEGRQLRLSKPLRLSRVDGGWSAAPTTLTYGAGSTRFSGRWGSGRSDLQLNMSKMPLSLIDIAFDDLGLGGVANGTVKMSQQASQTPVGEAKLTISGLTRSGVILTSTPVDLGLNLAISSRNAAARGVIRSPAGKTIGRFQGRVSGLGSGNWRTELMRNPLFAQARFNGSADSFWRLMGIETFDLTGPVAVSADISGTLAKPQIKGRFNTQNARLESGLTGTVISQIKANGEFDGSRLILPSVTGVTKGGGSVSGKGSFNFAVEPGVGVGIEMDINAKNAALIARDDFAATITGPIKIRNGASGGVISGDVTLNRSYFKFGQASAVVALPQINTREINRRADERPRRARSRPWRFALNANAPNRLQVEGLGLDSEWRANLKVSGPVDNFAMVGNADLVRGNYTFAGRRFRLERGRIRFVGNQPANPILDIEAEANLTGLNATINVTGTGNRPEIAFASVPALPEDELLSQILFGASISDLSAPEAVQLAAAVASLNSGGGLDPINQLRKAVGLDRLRILPSDTDSGQGTSIAAGKYITRQAYIELITDGKGYSASRLEFQITRWLSILSSISTLGRQSANIRVSKDY